MTLQLYMCCAVAALLKAASMSASAEYSDDSALEDLVDMITYECQITGKKRCPGVHGLLPGAPARKIAKVFAWSHLTCHARGGSMNIFCTWLHQCEIQLHLRSDAITPQDDALHDASSSVSSCSPSSPGQLAATDNAKEAKPQHKRPSTPKPESLNVFMCYVPMQYPSPRLPM